MDEPVDDKSGDQESSSKRRKTEDEEETETLESEIINAPDDNIEAIEKQKCRAIELWGSVCARNGDACAVAEDVAAAVQAQLELGRVPPIFHAYVSLTGGKGLFPPDSSIVINSAAVKAGNMETKVNEGGGGQAEISLEGDYEEAFLNERGEARMKVRDDGIASPHMWTFSPKMTEHVVGLVNTPAEMVGEDVEVTHLSSRFGMVSKNNTNLITRRLSRGVVADCFHLSEDESSYAIVGCPGTGKSWTLVYALQQALLFDGACVMFALQKHEAAMVCIRKSDRVFVWEADTPRENLTSRLFRNNLVLVLLDPRESIKGGASYANGRRMLVFAASNNVAHFGNDISKVTGGAQRNLSPFSEAELRVALPRMTGSSQFSVQTALERSKDVGMLPRYILNPELYSERKKACFDQIELLKNSPKELEYVLKFNGLSDGRSTLPGTIFAVAASSTVADDGTPLLVGYDGETGVNYGERKITIMCESILTEIVCGSRKLILSFWAKIGCGELSGMGACVENLFWDDLKYPFCMRAWKLVKGSKKNELAKLRIEQIPAATLEDVKIDGLPQVFESVNIVCRMAKGCKLIDFAGPGRRVYQVTVSDDHGMALEGMISLLVAGGYLRRKEDDTIVMADKPPIPPLEFYWVVPFGIEAKWKNKPPKKKIASTKQKETTAEEKKLKTKIELVKKCLEEHVHQFALIMDEESPAKPQGSTPTQSDS